MAASPCLGRCVGGAPGCFSPQSPRLPASALQGAAHRNRALKRSAVLVMRSLNNSSAVVAPGELLLGLLPAPGAIGLCEPHPGGLPAARSQWGMLGCPGRSAADGIAAAPSLCLMGWV